MKLIEAGSWPCRVIDAQYGENTQGIPTVRINVALIGKDHDGQRLTYEEEVTNRSAPYIARTCNAVGWRGETLASLPLDVFDWIAESGGTSEVEIKHLPIKRGPRAGGIWAKASSIGGRPMLRPVAPMRGADADALMHEVMNGGGAPYEDYPPPGDDDLPFAPQTREGDRPRAGGGW